jgi:DNA-binding transcriptional regulator YdaS (Cro superfamily)
MDKHSLLTAIARLGGGARASTALGVKQPTLHQWKTGKRPIPEAKCRAIEILTEGAVTCESLRPDVDWRRWRDVEAARDAPPIDTDNERKAA